MTIAAYLMLYSLVVNVAGLPVLRWLSRDGHAPRLAVAAWLSAVGSVLISWLAAAVLVIFDVGHHWRYSRGAALGCWTRMHGVMTEHAGLTSRALLLISAAIMTAAVVVFGTRMVRTAIHLRARAHEHAQAVRMVGRRTRDDAVVVVDADKPAAYCVSGRPSAIVVTSGALVALDDNQLSAVLAHERAHLRGRHSLITASLRSLAVVFARVPLMNNAAAEVARLLEMCADDAAVRRHGRQALLSGLLALAGATPEPALGAATIAVLTRAERLVMPPHGMSRLQVMLTAVLAFIVAGPLATIALVAAGALMCSM